MFYKLLLILTCYNFYKSVKSFFKENVVVQNGELAEISTGKYVSLGMTLLFYVMVIALCLLPSLLF